jgi:hypothetical protein
MNKRGDVTSLIITLLIILFIIGLTSILFSKVFLQALGEFKTQEGLGNNTINTIETVEQKTIPFLDYFFLFSFIAILIGLIISSIYIDTNPAIVIIFVVALIIILVLGGIFANIFTEIGEESEIASTYNEFTYTKMIFNSLPLLILFTGVVIAVILYGKSKRLGGTP